MPVYPRFLGGRQPESVPADIYASQVEALFSDAQSLLIGVVAACLTALTTAFQTRQWPILAVALALALLGAVRMVAMRRFARRKGSLSRAELRTWEIWYVAGGSTHLALLGLYCLFAFVLTDDAAARLASISITMAYLIGTPGRSFASNLLVNAQIIAAGVPMLVALAIAGFNYWSIILFVMVPFFLALKTISNRLRGIFLAAVMRARELSRLADRFDMALTNMPQGLAMFEPDGKVSVANERFSALMRIPAGGARGQTIRSLLRLQQEVFGLQTGPMTDTQRTVEEDWAERREWIWECSDGRSIEFKLQPMSNGGGVLIVDDVTERVRTQANINFLAHFDHLTCLPNRRSFSAFVESIFAADGGQNSALMFIDLDQFKQVNDTLGHSLGDKLLRSVADRLRSAIHPEGMVARFGGDEFVLFQDFHDAREGAAQLASRIIRLMSDPFHIEGQEIVVGASIGIALVHVEGGDVDKLLQDADLALYRAKAEGRRTFRFFEGEMQVQAQARREIEKDLREALARGEMLLHYQPIFDLKQNRYVSCEALIRWRHPERGMIPPSDFIPVAEEIGLISDLGAWVLQQASRDCATWPANMKVAVNVSAMEFRRGNIVSSVKQAVAEAGLDPGRLEIEITETVLLQDLPKTRALLLQLRAAGIRLSLDDFGTGYSSLSYLHSLPLNKVKIDRSFLKELPSNSRSMTLLRGIARLSVDLGMAVVMEGVETEDQLAAVAGANITQIQGFLYSRPLPGDQILRLLQDQQRSAA